MNLKSFKKFSLTETIVASVFILLLLCNTIYCIFSTNTNVLCYIIEFIFEFITIIRLGCFFLESREVIKIAEDQDTCSDIKDKKFILSITTDSTAFGINIINLFIITALSYISSIAMIIEMKNLVLAIILVLKILFFSYLCGFVFDSVSRCLVSMKKIRKSIKDDDNNGKK